MACTCNIRPGKFEGEPAITYLAYLVMLDGCTESVPVDDARGEPDDELDDYDDDDPRDELAHATDIAGAAIAPSTRGAARCKGYCAECINAALSDALAHVDSGEVFRFFQRGDGFVVGLGWEAPAS